MKHTHLHRTGQIRIQRTFLAVALITVLGLAGSARAALMVTTGPDNADTDNVLSGGGCTGHVDEGNPISGCLNQDHAATVLFSTTHSTGLHYVSGGQAEVDGGAPATPDLFGDLTIYRGGNAAFTKLVVDIDRDQHSSGFVQFSDGALFSSLFSLGNGSNFFTIEGGPFSSITLRTYSDASGTTAAEIVHDVKQVRIGGEGIIPAPEPATLALLGLGLAGLGLSRHKP